MPKSRNLDYDHKAFTISAKKISAEALTLGPRGVSQEQNLAEVMKMTRCETLISKHVNASMLTPAPKGVSQEPNLAEIRESVKHRKHGHLDQNGNGIHNNTYAMV